MKLADAEAPIRAALERLAESPRALGCFVVIQEPLTGRFVQFCTPPPPSKFAHSPRLIGDEPLIYDGGGNGKVGGYEPVQTLCDVDTGVSVALDTLKKYLPPEAELHIIEDSTRTERPS